MINSHILYVFKKELEIFYNLNQNEGGLSNLVFIAVF